MSPKAIATIGLACDMIGAILVAIEIVRVYRGHIAYGIDGRWIDMGKPKPKYIKFERGKRVWMAIGLGFLLIGFTLQIIALWIK